jgi:ubiquinone biosynthesis accessory factor UbiK
MLDPQKLEQFAKQITDAMPEGIKSMANETETKVKQVIQAQLAKMDIVTREEFDVQSQVLLRTREKLKALETRLDALENNSNAK